MKTIFLLLLCIVCILCTKIEGKTIIINNSVDGYYWRDYVGKIPPDAIPGGKDAENKTTYIGQTVHRSAGVIVPGKIIESEKKIVFEFDHLEHSETEDVKILCSQQQERFQWIKAEQNVSVPITIGDKELVISGHDRPFPVAIGRKWIGGELQVGKVMVKDNAFYFFRTTKDGKGFPENFFEVLVYDPNVDAPNLVDDTTKTCHKTININIH